MAKKKQDDGEDVKFDVKNSIVSKYGDVIRLGSEIVDEKLEVFSTGSPALDFVMKGWMEGTTNLISGPKKLGKTSLVLSSFVDYQRRGRSCYIFDTENRLKNINLTGIKGLDPAKVNVIRPTKGNDLTGNQLLDIVMSVMAADAGSAIFIDSASAILPAERVGEGIESQFRSSAPKLLGDFFRKCSSVIRVNKISLFLSLHLIANTSGTGGRKYLEDSGNYIMYQSDSLLRGEWSEKWVAGETTIGQIIHWNLVTGSMTSPCDKITSYLRYGEGFDSVKETLILGLEMGLVSLKGSWYELSYLDEPVKYQGDEKVLAHFHENPEHLELLTQKIKELFA
jgi:hypothetical protein